MAYDLATSETIIPGRKHQQNASAYRQREVPAMERSTFNEQQFGYGDANTLYKHGCPTNG